jgi:hypothetical protein
MGHKPLWPLTGTAPPPAGSVISAERGVPCRIVKEH